MLAFFCIHFRLRVLVIDLFCYFSLFCLLALMLRTNKLLLTLFNSAGACELC